MRQRLLSFFLVFVMVITLVTPAMVMPDLSHGATTFKDVKDHWAEEYINTAVSSGFVKGYPEGDFLPDNPVTRAEFSKMINTALKNTSTESVTFSDVPRTEWFHTDVAKAVAAGYVGGYDDNTFKPNEKISRQEAAVVISRLVPTYGAGISLKNYKDYSDIDVWAISGMEKAVGKKYMGAYDDKALHPKDFLTRAQTAKIICDILSKESIVGMNTIVNTDNTNLSGKIYTNGVTISQTLGDGEVEMSNVVILGNLSIQGGGTDTITVKNSRVASCTINKSSDAVRVLATGETTINKAFVSEEATLQTEKLTGASAYGYGKGFGAVNVNGSAEATLTGTFPRVNVIGSSAKVYAESAAITLLDVTSAGKNSDITLDNKSSMSTANVNGVAEFRGSGTISKMNANVSGITYEEKPKSISTASNATAPKEVDIELNATFDPEDDDTKVAIDKKITITFNMAICDSDGDSFKDSDIEDMIELREEKSSGSHVPFSGEISSDDKVITIEPDSDLDEDTDYYLSIAKDTFEDSEGNGNDAYDISFTTGDEDDIEEDEDGVTFDPRAGATGVKDTIDPTINFESSIETYSGNDITDDYLEDEIIFREENSSGDKVAFSASINSTDKEIEIEPDRSLDDGKYYISFDSRAFREKSSEDYIPAKSVTWTVGEGVELNSLSVSSPTVSQLVFKFKPSEDGRVYAIAVPADGTNKCYKEPTAKQIKDGEYYYTSSKERSATSENDISVDRGDSESLTLNGTYEAGKKYTVYAYLDSGSEGDSEVEKVTVTIPAAAIPVVPTATLITLNITPNEQSAKPVTISNTMTKTIDFAESVIVTAGGNSGEEATIYDGTDGTTGSKTITFGIRDEVTLKIKMTGTNKNSKDYTLTIKRSEPDLSLKEVNVGGNSIQIKGDNEYSYVLKSGEAATYTFTPTDPKATVEPATGSILTEKTLNFTVSRGVKSKNYTLTVKMQAPASTQDQ